MENKRIWELDALRGICILAMVWLHLRYDLQEFCGIAVSQNRLLSLAMSHGGKVFVVLSGLCAALGSRSVRRGLLVLSCGLLVSLVTKFTGEQTAIRFGILHLLGTAMILWPLLRRLPPWALALLGSAAIVTGTWFGRIIVAQSWLYPLGLCSKGFFSADYFPLFPYFGWFLLGGMLGKTLYRKKVTLLPRFPNRVWPVRFFASAADILCGSICSTSRCCWCACNGSRKAPCCGLVRENTCGPIFWRKYRKNRTFLKKTTCIFGIMPL